MQHNSNNKLDAFTIVEILIVAPIVILVIGVFIGAIVNMTGDVLSSRGANVMASNIQDTLSRIKQDVNLSGSFLATNNITVTSPQGYNNDTTAFHNADSTNGTMLILNAYATTNNPLSSIQNIIYANSPNLCSSAQVSLNPPLTMNIIYFVKNNTLWRRVIMPSNYTTAGCSLPWQQPSCAIGQIGTMCKAQDIDLVDGVSSSGFNVSYYPNPSSITANGAASDYSQPDASRQTALNSNNTVGVTITATQNVAGRVVSQTGTVRANSQNSNAVASVVTSGMILNLDAGSTVSYPGSGTAWYDLSGAVNNGSLVNGVGYTSNNGGALTFDGVDDNVSVPDNTSLRFGTGSFTVGFWCYRTLSGYQGGSYITKGTHGSPGIDTFDGTFEVSTSAGYLASIGLSATIGIWEYHTFVVNQTASPYIQHYINGVLNQTGYTETGKLGSVDNANSIIIGKSVAGGVNRYFNGSIGIIQIYNRALSLAEIQQNFNAIKGRYGM
jgi:competence protein ComGC